MNGLDWLIAGGILLSVVLSVSQGFLYEVASLAGVIVGYMVAAWEYPRVANWFAPYVKTPWVGNVAGFVTIFLAIVILAGIVGRIARWGAGAAGLRWFDRALGGLFGLARGVLLVMVLLLAVTSWVPSAPWLANSRLAPYMLVLARAAIWVAPSQVRLQFYDGMKQIRDFQVSHGWQAGK